MQLVVVMAVRKAVRAAIAESRGQVIDLFPEDENRETEVSGFRFFSSKAVSQAALFVRIVRLFYTITETHLPFGQIGEFAAKIVQKHMSQNVLTLL